MLTRFEGRWIALLAVTAVLIYLCWLMLRPFVDVVLWAAVLAIVSYPLQARLVRRTGRPSLSAILTCLAVIAVVVVPVTFIGLAVLKQAAGLASSLPATAERLLNPESSHMQFIGRYVDLETVLSPSYLVDRMRAFSGVIAARSFDIIGGVLGTAAQLFFMLFTLYFLLRDSKPILSAVHDMLPLDEADTQDLSRRTQEIIQASVYGVLVIAVIQGFIGGVAFAALGLPSPILWGVVMVVLSMIPLAGSAIVWGPAALILLVQGHWIKATILVAVGTLVIGMIDNLLRPRLVGEKTRLHELLVFFSVLGGLQVFGVLGIVVGPVVLALALAMFDVFRKAERAAAERRMVAAAGPEAIVPEDEPAPVVVAPVQAAPQPAAKPGSRRKWKKR